MSETPFLLQNSQMFILYCLYKFPKIALKRHWITKFAAVSDIQIVATEVLRGHFSRPGLLAVEGGRLKLTPTKPGPTDSNRDAPLNNDPSVVTLAAVADFNRAINACVHAEKEYIRRVSTILCTYMIHSLFLLNYAYITQNLKPSILSYHTLSCRILSSSSLSSLISPDFISSNLILSTFLYPKLSHSSIKSNNNI